jgi:hypothetical protein
MTAYTEVSMQETTVVEVLHSRLALINFVTSANGVGCASTALAKPQL